MTRNEQREYERRFVGVDVSEEEYYAAKAKLADVQAKLDACPGILTMRAMSLKQVGRWERYKARLNSILDPLETLVDQNTCSCGDYRWDCTQGRRVSF